MQRGRVLLVIICFCPMMRNRYIRQRTGINRVAIQMRRNDGEVQHNDTVATVDIGQCVTVDAGFIQRIFAASASVACPCMLPYIRQFAVDDGYVLIRRVNRSTYLQVQLDDTVASVECTQRVVINTRYLDIALIRYVVLNAIPVLVELERIAVTDGVSYDGIINLTVEYCQVIIVVVELIINILDCVGVVQDSRILAHRRFVIELEVIVLVKVIVEEIRHLGIILVVEDVGHILVRYLADGDRVIVAIYRIYEQMQRHRVLAVLAVRVGVLRCGVRDGVIVSAQAEPFVVEVERIALRDMNVNRVMYRVAVEH